MAAKEILSGLLDSKGSAQYSLIDNTLNIELSDNLKILMKNKKTGYRAIQEFLQGLTQFAYNHFVYLVPLEDYIDLRIINCNK